MKATRQSQHYRREAAFIRSGKRPGVFRAIRSTYRTLRMSRAERQRLHGRGGMWEQERIVKPLRDLHRVRTGKMSYAAAARKYRGRIIDRRVRAQFGALLRGQKQA